MATFELWDKGFKFLKERFLAYPPYTKTGECTENYVVFRDDTTGPKSNYSSEVHYYSVICYSKSYSSVLKYADEVKKSMEQLFPFFVPSGIQTPTVYDDSVKAFTTSIQYRANVRNKLL